MKRSWLKNALFIAAILAIALTVTPARSDDDDDDDDRDRELIAQLNGYQEVPPISTTGRGEFRARLTHEGIAFVLRYSRLEGGAAAAAHIHFGQVGVNGGVSAFLCGGGGKPPCPASPAVVRGLIERNDIIGPTGQGIAPGELGELLRAIRAGRGYANVHNARYPTGEIRGQIRLDDDD